MYVTDILQQGSSTRYIRSDLYNQVSEGWPHSDGIPDFFTGLRCTYESGVIRSRRDGIDSRCFGGRGGSWCPGKSPFICDSLAVRGSIRKVGDKEPLARLRCCSAKSDEQNDRPSREERDAIAFTRVIQNMPELMVILSSFLDGKA